MNKVIKSLAKGCCRITFPVTEKLFDLCLGKRVARTQLFKPVIIIGPERSGTTLVYAVLSNHPDVYALSSPAEWCPKHPFTATMIRRMLSTGPQPIYTAVPNTTGVVRGGRFFPTEAIEYWLQHLRTWRGDWQEAADEHFSDEDLDDETRRRLPLDLKKRICHLRYHLRQCRIRAIPQFI